jgi:uroporphyrinogen decarboxylase
MISRERIRAAINHREPDQVPIDLAGYFASGMAAIAYAKLRRYLGLEDKPIRVYDPHQVLAVIDQDIIERFGVDTVQAGRAFDQDESCWGEWVLPDGTPCKWPVWAMPERHEDEWVLRSATGKIVAHMPPGVLNFEPVNYPFAENDSLNINDIRVAITEFQFTGVPGPTLFFLNNLMARSNSGSASAPSMKVRIAPSFSCMEDTCWRWDSGSTGQTTST